MAAATMASAGCVAALAPVQALAGSAQSRVSVRATPARVTRCIVRASAQESSQAEPSKAAVVFSAALGALAAVSMGFGGEVQAALGPGTGAQRTAEKADELLKAADELTTDDSPPRFGPGRNTREGAEGDETSKLARQAGSGSAPSLQGTQNQLEGAAANTSEFASNLVGSTQSGENPISKAAEGASFFSSIQDSLSNLTGGGPSTPDLPSPGEAKGAVDSVASQVKAKAGL